MVREAPKRRRALNWAQKARQYIGKGRAGREECPGRGNGVSNGVEAGGTRPLWLEQQGPGLQMGLKIKLMQSP